MKNLIFFFILILNSSQGHAGQYGFFRKSFSAFFEGSYFNTNQNFTDSGTVSGLPPDSQFTEFRYDLQSSYDFANWWGIYSALTLKQVNSARPSANLDNSGFTDMGIGARAKLWSGFVDVVPDLYFSLPFYASGGPDNSALLGDGAFVLLGRIYLLKEFSSTFQAYAFAGYRYLSEGLSASFPLGASVRFAWSPIFFEAQLYGFFSAANDQYASSPLVRKNLTDRLDGGSYIYDTVNPSAFNTTARLGWWFASRLFATLGVDQTLWGQRTAQGTRFLLGIGLSDEPIKGPAKRAKDVDSFVPDVE